MNKSIKDLNAELAKAAQSIVQKSQEDLVTREFTEAMMPSKDALHELDSQGGIMVLVKGTLEDKTDFYAYISIHPSKYMAFLEAEKVGGYKLTDYGTVLASGKGKEPSAEVVKEMEEVYGANHDFESDYIQATRNQLAKLPQENT